MRGEIDRSLLANLSIKYEIMYILNFLSSFFSFFKIVPMKHFFTCTMKQLYTEKECGGQKLPLQ